MKTRSRLVALLFVSIACAGCNHRIANFHPLAPPEPVTLACSVRPAVVFPGDPVTIFATLGNQDPKLGAKYSISGEGIIEGNSATATVDTSALSAGTHTINCAVKEGKPGKEGRKPGQSAQSTVTFLVKEFDPPTVSCSVNPTTIRPGDTATVTSMATSPQNRPLTYTYSSSAGSVTGSGTTASFSSTGAPAGPVSISCNVADDMGHTASSETSQTILAPLAAPAPHTQGLCSISFAKDMAHPTLVDNEALACLDEVSLDLQRQSDAKLVIVGQMSAIERAKSSPPFTPAAQRAINTKAYLAQVKGADPSRIVVAIDSHNGQNAEMYLIPAGASFDSDLTGTIPFDESRVPPQTANGRIPSTAPSQQNAGSNGATACHAFALFGYPVKIDLAGPVRLPQSFELIAANFDPIQGVSVLSGVASTLCEAAGQKTECISNAIWQSVSKGCDERPAQDLTVGKGSYQFKIWPIVDALPTSICENIQVPSTWVELAQPGFERCQPSIDGVFYWRWSGMIKDPSFKLPGDTNISLYLSSNATPARALSKKYDVDLQPISQTVFKKAGEEAASEAKKKLGEWIKENFGKLLGGIGTALLALISPKLPKWLKRLVGKESEEKPNAATPPTIIVITPPAPNQLQQGQPDTNTRLRRRPTHRWRNGG